MSPVDRLRPSPRRAAPAAPPAARRIREVTLALGLLVASACTVETPPNAVAAPDPTKLTIFFPIDNLVVGRGSPGSLPTGAEYVFVRPLAREATSSIIRVAADGSFTFQVAAGTREVLEIAVALDPQGTQRGGPTYVEVPTRFAPGEPHRCCKQAGAELGRCEPASNAMCLVSNFITRECTSDLDCTAYSGETLPIPEDAFRAGRPDARGNVVVDAPTANVLPPLTLVTLENRGVPGARTGPFLYRQMAITDEQGKVRFEVPAQGDDELVLRLHAVDAINRSREHAVYVPDPELGAFDVVGILPYGPLKNGQPGSVAIRFAPSGVDSRGLCLDRPQDDSSPALCFSAGGAGRQDFAGTLPPEAISFQNGQIQLGGLGVPVRIDDDPRLRFTDGDVRAPPRDLFILVDRSADAQTNDGRRVRFDAARVAFNAARQQDRIALVLLRNGTFDIVQPLTEATPEAKARMVGQLASPPDVDSGGADLFDAVRAVGRAVRDDGRGRDAMILALMASAPAGCTAYDAALDATGGDEDLGIPRIPTYVVRVRPVSQADCYPNAMLCSDAASCVTPQPGQRVPNDDISGLSAFSAGEYVEIDSAQGLVTQSTRLASLFVGAFVMVYDIDRIPEALGDKLVNVSIQATLTINGDPPQDALYEGWLELRDAE